MDQVETVVVDNHKSEEAKVISGEPQGSVLGPDLFLTYISDISVYVRGSVLTSFTDDTNVSCAITSAVDTIQVQQDMDTVYTRPTTNNLQFN